ncbi:MAG: hypothetical protein D6B25_12550 [Desulfobulbaceae bacterium]|nr:MAG: hypothetical protein D6B25_12550 [Desulfobulbaceae bacterium]
MHLSWPDFSWQDICSNNREDTIMGMEEVRTLIADIYRFMEAGDEKQLYEHSAEVMSVYLEALNDIYFDGERVEWLNQMINAIDEGDSQALVQALEQGENGDDVFLGSQIAAIFAGFRQQDAMGVVAQATGLKALLDQMES